MDEARSLIPDKFRILSGSMLKVIALVCMLIDHSAFFLLHDCTAELHILRRTVTVYGLMRGIGRLAFPIYAFLLTEGFIHTGSRVKYGLSLIIFAFISEIPWNLNFSGQLIDFSSMNVFFTLFMGYLGIWSVEKFRNDRPVMLLCLLLLLVCACFGGADYGISGFGFILIVYLLRNDRLIQAAAGICILPNTWKAGLAFIPISLYNGKRGFIKGSFAKYCFYAIYPVHMTVLYLCSH